MASSLLDAQREAVAAASRRLAAEGLLIGTAGNVSARAGDALVVTPTGAVLAELEADQLAVVDLAGESFPGSPAPTSELELHLGATNRLGAGAVVHTHSPMATALSCVVEEVPVVHYSMLQFGGAVPVAPYATFGTPELAELVITALAGRRAALMASHGAVCWAATLDEAVELALLLEWACGVFWRAAAIGSPRVMTDAEQQDVLRATAPDR